MGSYLEERDNSLGYLTGVASRLISGRLSRRFAKAGIELTTEQWAVLIRLWDRDGLTQQDIADSLVLEKSSVSRLVDGLERHGWIDRRKGSTDARQKQCWLTPKAVAVQEESIRIDREVRGEVQQPLDDEEQALLKALLLRVIRSLL